MQQVLSNTYIVWFKDCFETAEEAALALNGQTVFPLQHPQETVQSAVGRVLEQRVGYAKSLIHMVEPVAEYVRRENVFENTPCRSNNCYTAAVVIPPAARQPESAVLPSGTAAIVKAFLTGWAAKVSACTTSATTPMWCWNSRTKSAGKSFTTGRAIPSAAIWAA